MGCHVSSYVKQLAEEVNLNNRTEDLWKILSPKAPLFSVLCFLMVPSLHPFTRDKMISSLPTVALTFHFESNFLTPFH